MNKARKFFQDQSGVTAVEYALIAALISLVIVAATTTIGTKLVSVFQRVATILS